MRLLYSIHRYDVFMFLWLLRSKRREVYARVCRYVSMTGDGHLYLLLAGGLFWVHSFEAMTFLKCLILAFSLERPLYFVIKNGFKRNRPAAALKNFQSSIVPSDQFSFPSGHTSAAFLVATLFSTFHPSLTVLLYSWAALIGVSRVILGVHFPTDTLVGAAMGMSIALFSLRVMAS